MAIHGRNTTVLWNSTVMSGYLNQTDFEVSVDTHDVSTYGMGWKQFTPGLFDSTTGFQGFYDAAAGTVVEAALATDAGVLTYCPDGGTAVGGRARLISMTTANYSESSPVGDVVTFAWDVQSESTTGFGQVLHPMGEDTNTTTNASTDDTAATSTGWVAHLHVTLVDGGSWVVKLEDSADNASWADVSGGAFTSTSGVTAERLRSSTSTAQLRRYVRCTATRTGGSAGQGITYHLSYARNY